MSKFSKILQACEIFSNLVKKADYSADITDGKRALNNLKSAIEGLDIQSFKNLLIEEGDEYRYLPGYLLGDQYKDCRIHLLYNDEESLSDKFMKFKLNQPTDGRELSLQDVSLQDTYDIEFKLSNISSLSSYDHLEDEEKYLTELKNEIIKACLSDQSYFYHEIAHLKRMKNQTSEEFLKHWDPSKRFGTGPRDLITGDNSSRAGTKPINVRTDLELYPIEIEQFSHEIKKLINRFKASQKYKDSGMTFLNYLEQNLKIRSKIDFVDHIIFVLFGTKDLNYENDYFKSVAKRASKFYDDMVAGKFKDTLGI